MKGTARAGLRYGVLTLFVIFTAFPFYVMLVTTFKHEQILRAATFKNYNPFIFYTDISTAPEPTMENINTLFGRVEQGGLYFQQYVVNSLIVGVLVVLITLVLAVPAAYSLARLAGRWGENLGIMIFMVYIIPPTLLFIPMARVVAILGLSQTIWALVVVYPTFTVPFCTWLLMGFMKSIPADVEEQAMVDGYSRFGAIVRVVFPMALPGILTIIVFAFTLTMHEYIYALTFITQASQKVIGTGVTSNLIRGDELHWQAIMAAGLFVAIPVALVYNLFLDRFVAGFTLGAVKG